MSGLAEILNDVKSEAEALDAAEINFYHKLKPLIGVKVRILCPRYNGQPHGRSKKPLTGREFRIAWAHRWGNTVAIGFTEHAEGIKIDDVMLITEPEAA